MDSTLLHQRPQDTHAPGYKSQGDSTEIARSSGDAVAAAGEGEWEGEDTGNGSSCDDEEDEEVVEESMMMRMLGTFRFLATAFLSSHRAMLLVVVVEREGSSEEQAKVVFCLVWWVVAFLVRVLRGSKCAASTGE